MFLENFPLLNSIFKHTAFDYFNKFIKVRISGLKYDNFRKMFYIILNPIN